MKAEIKAKSLKEIAQILGVLVDEALFVLNKDGLSIKAVDPAHVAMVDLNFDSSGFESLETSDTETKLGIGIDKFSDHLKLAKDDQIVGLDYFEDSNKLSIKFGNLTRIMSLLDTSKTIEPKIPSLNLSGTVQMQAQVLQDGIKASELITDHILLTISPDGFKLDCRGELDKVFLEIPKDELELHELKVDTPVKSLYSLEYLKSMAGVIPSSYSLELHLGTDFPLELLFKFAGTGDVKYMLAPRLEDD